MLPTDVDVKYYERNKAMTPSERLERCTAMLNWTRQQVACRIRQADPNISDEELKWRVALRLYGDEPAIVKLIESQLAYVCD